MSEPDTKRPKWSIGSSKFVCPKVRATDEELVERQQLSADHLGARTKPGVAKSQNILILDNLVSVTGVSDHKSDRV